MRPSSTSVRRSFACPCLAALVASVALAVLGGCAGAGGNRPTVDGFGVPVAPGLRGYPFAASRSVTDSYFGTDVNDDFTWLENAADPATRAWTAAENAYGRRYLDAMPARAALRQRLQALLGSTGNAHAGLVERGGVLFALKTAPPLQRPVLVALRSADDPGSERVLFDPSAGAADASLAIDFFRPSPDGRRVAVGTSTGGPDGTTVRVLDVATGQWLADALPRAGQGPVVGDVAWSPGGGGLFCTRVGAAAPVADGTPPALQVVFHKLGTLPAQDRVEPLSSGLPRAARVRLETPRDGRSLLAIVENGRGGDVALYVKPSDANGEGTWRRLASEADGVRDAQFGDDDALWVRSVLNAPRGKVLRIAPGDTKAIGWERLAAVGTPQEGVLQRFAVASGTLYMAEASAAGTRLRAIDVRTRRGSTVALPAGAGVAALVRVGKSDMLAQTASYLEPPAWTHVAGARPRRSALVSTSDANFNDSEVVRELATSRDGTPLPVDILRRRSTKLDGRNPVLLVPGGSAGVAAGPDFDPLRRLWLDRGGVIAIAAVRGVADGGEAWRADGVRTRKQNAVDDVIGVAEHLVRRGYTQPALLALRARGEGALIAGAALVQRPELFRAVVAAQGRYDLLRLERDPAGAYDAPELGSVRERAQFDALFALSPLRQVRDGGAYPSVLLVAGDRDGRTSAGQSRKMVARLQQANPSGRVVLLRTDNASGPGQPPALGEGIELAADELGFLLNEVLAAQ